MDYVDETDTETNDDKATNTNTNTNTSASVEINRDSDDRMAAPTEGGVVTSGKHVAIAADESKKSERKRKRERQRRSDLATAFEELSTLVIQIDPDDNDPQFDADGVAIRPSTISSSATTSSVRDQGAMGIGSSKRIQRRKSGGDADTSAGGTQTDIDGSVMTRLDLIGRTTMLLRRLQRENIDLRRRLNDYKIGRPSGSGTTGSHTMGIGALHDDTEVLVMVPTLTPSDMYGHGLRGPAGSYPLPHHSQQQQQVPPEGARGYYMYQQHPSMSVEQQQYGPPPPATTHNMYYHNPSAYSPYSGARTWGVEGGDSMNITTSPSPQHHHPFYPGLDVQLEQQHQSMHQSSSPPDDVSRSHNPPGH